MDKVMLHVRSWPAPMALVLCMAMLLGSTTDEIDAPDWLAEAWISFWTSPAPEVPDQAPPSPPRDSAPDLAVPYAPVPGRDDRTPLAFLNHVFDLGNPGLTDQLSGIGPVSWDHAGTGSGTLIARDVVLTTGHLFVERGLWDGPLGRTERPPPPSNGRIYLAACGRAYDFQSIELGSLAPRERLGLDYAIARLAEPACEAARVLPVALTPRDVAEVADQMLLSLGAYPFADVPWYANHPLFADRDPSQPYARYAVFGVRCEATGLRDTGDVGGLSTGLVLTSGCDAVPGGSGGALLASRDGGARYVLIGVTNSYRRNTEFNNYTSIEGVFAEHLSRYVTLQELPPASTTAPNAASRGLGAEAPDGPWLPLTLNEENQR